MKLIRYFLITCSALLIWLGVSYLLQLQPVYAQQNCDPSYPDVCIASPPPDLDCKDVSYQNFRVVGSDPHRFDGDQDGIGCEA